MTACLPLVACTSFALGVPAWQPGEASQRARVACVCHKGGTNIELGALCAGAVRAVGCGLVSRGHGGVSNILQNDVLGAPVFKHQVDQISWARAMASRMQALM